MVVDIFCQLVVVVGGVGYILAGGGLWWMVVGGGGYTLRGRSRVSPLMQMTKSYFLPMKCQAG